MYFSKFFVSIFVNLKTKFQSILFYILPQEVLNTTGLPGRASTFYFGMNLPMNGYLDFAHLYYDSVNVNIEWGQSFDFELEFHFQFHGLKGINYKNNNTINILR